MWALAAFAAVAAALAAYCVNNLPPRRVLPGLAALPESDERRLTGSTKTARLINPQGVETFVRVWGKDGEGKSTVVMLHGFSWHSQYFAPLAQRLADEGGFKVIAYDLQGHGRSGLVDGAKGYATRFDDWVRELNQVVGAHAASDKGKLFIFAESMGATIALRALTGATKLFPRNVSGIVFSGPVIRVAPEVLPPKPVVFVIKALATVFPLLSVPSSEVADGFEGAFGDQSFAKQAKKDPLVIFDNPRLRSAAEILATVDANCKAFSQVTQPLLVLHGDQDKRTHAANSVEFVGSVSSSDKRLEIIKGGNHQLLQDQPALTAAVTEHIVAFFKSH
jgi:acylglycerol lipase